MEEILESIIALLQAGNTVDSRRIAEDGEVTAVAVLLQAGNRVDALTAAEDALDALEE
jgi:hypothetical protein